MRKILKKLLKRLNFISKNPLICLNCITCGQKNCQNSRKFVEKFYFLYGNVANLEADVMGVARSALQRALHRPLQYQKQVEKVIDKEPILAPKHETTKALLDTAKEENKEQFDLYNKKSEEYLKLLSQIHVESIDVPDKKIEEKSSLSTSERLTSEQLALLFQQRMTKPEVWTEAKIAAHFKLPERSVENLLKYYSDFHIQKGPDIPEPLAEITH